MLVTTKRCQISFKKTRELGSKGKICNPLLLEEFEWENEWVDKNCEPVHAAHGNELTWANVHEAIRATESLVTCLGLLLLVQQPLSARCMLGGESVQGTQQLL